MTDPGTSRQPLISQQLTELKLLYQFSNTMLSTISLNKLTHLILTALTSGKSALFDRVMIFLRNERSGTLQGMLGVSRETAGELEVFGDEDVLSCRWDISDELMARQKSTEFCKLVRSSRIDLADECPVITQVVSHHKLSLIHEDDCLGCPSCTFLKRLGAKSFAAAPLVAREKSLGIIVVDNPITGKEITSDELHFLQLFANQAGMAIENSMLYHRIDDAHSNLRDARERLVHGERLAAIGEMAANLAHELKNPLITIGGFAGRLLKHLPDNSTEHHYADTIVKEVCRLEKMLADILAFSRKPTICYTICKLGEILTDCFDNCATNLEDHGIKLSTNLTDREWMLLGDAYQLKQVFLNLILNACEVMPDGGALTITAESRSEHSDESVVLRFKDTGSGIPADILPKIFNPFFTTKHHGTGLGLAIANRILLNHNGTITAHNDDDGAVFTIILPLALIPGQE